MVSEGVKIRAQIDTESVRNVMLVNGGGSVALLALLPTILGTLSRWLEMKLPPSNHGMAYNTSLNLTRGADAPLAG